MTRTLLKKISRLKTLYVLIFVLLLEIVLIAVYLPYHNKFTNNPAAFPYSFNYEYRLHSFENLIPGVFFKSNSIMQPVKTKRQNGSLDIVVYNNTLDVDHYIFGLPINANLPSFPNYDVDMDGREELVVFKNFGSGLKIGIIDYSSDSIRYFDFIDSSLGFTDKIIGREVFDFVNYCPVESDSHFVLAAYSSRKDEFCRGVLLYKKGNPPIRKAFIPTGAYPFSGFSYTDNKHNEKFIIGGYTTFNNHQVDLDLQYNGNVLNVNLNDTIATLIQINTKIGIEWVSEIDYGGGNLDVWSDEESQRGFALFHGRNYLNNRKPFITECELDLNDGRILSRSKFTGDLLRFTGSSIKESPYIGVFLDSLNYISFLDRTLNHEENKKDHLLTELFPLPLIEPVANEFLFLIKSKNDVVYAYDFNLECQAIYNGAINLMPPLRFMNSNGIHDFVCFQGNDNQKHIYSISQNQLFSWWLARYKWLISLLLIPALFIISGFSFIKYIQSKIDYRESLIASNERLKKTVAEKTNNLRKVNNDLKREIAERQVIARENERQKQHLEQIFNHSMDALITINKKGETGKFNDRFRDLFQLPDDITVAGINALFKTKLSALKKITDKNFLTGRNCFDQKVEINLSPRFSLVVKITTVMLNNRTVPPNELLVSIRDVTGLYGRTKSQIININYCDIIGSSAPMQEIFSKLEDISNTLVTALITGESGTGKELIARAIYQKSVRCQQPFETVNCAAIPVNLFESELFGHKKGAFTGAVQDKKGLFEIASSGTLFLDEISELPVEIQPKLLRVLQEGEFRRIGDEKIYHSDARIIAATNRDLKDYMAENNFRHDLYYRINKVLIEIPPLRNRREDIPLLVNHFIKFFNETLNRKITGIDDEPLEIFMRYHWEGNIRELENTIEHCFVFCPDNENITPKHLPKSIYENLNDESFESQKPKSGFRHLSRQESIELIQTALLQNNGNITATAKSIGVTRSYLHRKMRQFAISSPIKV